MSDLSIEEYYNELKDKINLSANAHEAPQESQFLTYMLDTLQEAREIETYQLIDDARDANDRFRADAFIEEDSNLSTGMLGIVISLYDHSPSPENLTRSELEKFLKKIRAFINIALEKDIDEIFEINGGAHQLAYKVKNVFSSERPKLNFYIVSNKPLSSRITDLEKIVINGVDINTHIWDLSRFYQLYLQDTDTVDIEIDLSTNPINVLEASSSDEKIQIFLGVIPGHTLFNIFHTYGSKLLEQNVRSFMGAKNPANKGMKETVRTAPEKFIAFNNGISATAESVITENISGQLKITGMTNFQIVNGGQTTATIYAAGKERINLDKIYVQMKLVVVKHENAADLLIKISEFSNTQSKVQKSDFFSHHDYHRRMHDFSKRFAAPPQPNSVGLTKWYYERIRKQYLNDQSRLTASEQRAFQREYPKQQLLTKTDLGKYIITFDCLPHVVCKGGEYNFVKFSEIIRAIWDKNEADINERYYKETIAKAIIWKNLNSLLAARSMQMTSPSKIGTYAISLLMNSINNAGYNFNLMKVWNIQSLPKNLESLLILISKEVHTWANDNSRPVENVDSYLKSEKFWELIKAKITQIDLGLISDLFLDRNEVTMNILDDRRDQRLTNALQIELMIKGVTSPQWNLVDDFLRAHGSDSPSKSDLIRLAKQSPHRLSPAQCKKIYDDFYAEYLELNPNL